MKLPDSVEDWAADAQNRRSEIWWSLKIPVGKRDAVAEYKTREEYKGKHADTSNG